MSEKQQKSITIVETGKPVVSFQRPVPTPKEGQVLVKVEAAHLLPHDSYMRDWGLFVAERLPFPLAVNVAGTIESIGSDTPTPFKQGDRIFGLSNLAYGPDQAGAQEFAILDIDAIAKIPDLFKKEDVVTVPANLITSFIALFSNDLGFNFPPPWEAKSCSDFDFSAQTLVILGAGSNCAKFAIQLGKICGIGKIIAVAGPANEKELRGLGATHFIDRHASDDEVKKQVHAITPQNELVYVYDTYSWTWELGASLMSTDKASRLAVLHKVNDPESITKINPKVRITTASCTNGNLGQYKEDFWKSLPGWLEEKEILPAAWKIVGNLDAVSEVNAVLDGYRDGRGGAQAIIVP